MNPEPAPIQNNRASDIESQDPDTRGSKGTTSDSSPQRAERFWARAIRLSLTSASWLLLVAAIAQWVLIRWLGDVWWVGTVALFAPRWLLFVPLAVITVLCTVWRRKLLWLSSASGLLLVGPVMGFCVPMSLGHARGEEFQLRVVTVNAGGATAQLLRRHLAREAPDVVAFQEFGRWTPAELLDGKWYWQIAAGIMIASRYPIQEWESFPASRVGRWGDVALRVRIVLPVGSVWVYSLHLNTPRWGLEDLAITRHGFSGVDALRSNTDERGVESQVIREWIADSDIPTIIVGDFNMPVESRFYRRDWSRDQNAFSTAGWGFGHTKFTRWHGVRIDHVLVDEKWRVIKCHVADSIGGDHRPVVADLVLQRS